MKKLSLRKRIAVSTLLVVMIACFVCAGGACWVATVWIYRQAAASAEHEANQALDQIASLDALSRQQVESGMRILQAECQQKGEPELKGSFEIGGRAVPDLWLGGESQSLNFGVVDRVKELVGGTATLFVWNGTDFVRVTTNVLKPDGSRAVGTVLDAKGKAFAALKGRHSFSGVVMILGIPYTTSYVPMFGRSGELVGAYYAGYRLDSMSALIGSITQDQILDHGFVALLDPSGAPVVRGQEQSSNQLRQVLDHPAGWIVKRKTYAPWGYTVVTAYPNMDVLLLEMKALSLPAAGTIAMVSLILWVQLLLMNRLVCVPVKDLTTRMNSADLNTLLDESRGDEIGALAGSFNHYVLRIRRTLTRVRESSAATSGKSDEIRGISRSMVTRMTEQKQHADEAAEAVERLSSEARNISQHTTEASGMAREAAEAAREGADLVTSSVSLMQGLSEGAQQSSNRIATLGARAQEIGSIAGVIDEIASATNMLALNASIEAARAGEHGRGFAVVAGEVRRLAERTAQATQQVSDLVEGIKSETAQTAKGVKWTNECASRSAEAVSSLNDTFGRIAALVVEVDARVEQIAEAAREEAVAAVQVAGTIQEVATTSQQNVGSVEQVVAVTSELMTTAGSLEEMVEQFHLQELAEDQAA
jgi:methyl-accepting chemotaxis protein